MRTARPRQWVKNVLVFAAPGAAGVLGHRVALVHTLLAAAVFCLAASGIYCINDATDVEADRIHPDKRLRPVAAGVVPVALARAAGLGLVLVAIALADVAGSPLLAGLVVVYAAITVSYSLWLKHEPVFDLAAVAAGFVIRAIAGGVAAGVPISTWFLIVVSFGSLFMVAGKRHSEHLSMGDERGSHRLTLELYSVSFLRYVRSMASAIAVTGYCLWAFERNAGLLGVPWFELSIVPFVLAILRYALVLEAGSTAGPEEIVLGERSLQLMGLACVVLVGLGIYAR
ncbi:MAG: decaprenyl-phosphate phosphoribosyltransferase [Chloroflexi bacterium]|nr:decaprenyl-phosphate phosphoribosyltransferase [Chloroflexota bacterium]